MREKWLIIGAFASIYIIWGSTYLANAIAIREIPPFFMASIRFVVAGLILLLIMRFQGKIRVSFSQFKNSILMGFLFLTVGNGCLVKALEYLDSGLASLIIAFSPLFTILLMWLLQGIRPGRRNTFGTLLGILGMGILVSQDNFISNPQKLTGLLLVGTSILAWTVASIYISSINMPKKKGVSTAIQMLSGGLMLFFYSLISTEFQDFHLTDVTQQSISALIYLIVFGSIIGFSSFNYLLLKVSPDKVATSTFINPIVALFLGWAFNNEQITSQSFIAGIVLLSGVLFISRHNRTSK